MQTDFTKMTDASLWGPKRHKECLLGLKVILELSNDINLELTIAFG